jgi:hypothetical protein
MDKVVIVGGYEFLGFCLGTSLLEKGYCVTCVHFEKPNDFLSEEKRFTVGRNANFQEIQIGDWNRNSRENEGDSLIVVSLYDVHHGNDKSKVRDEIFQSLGNMKVKNQEFVILLPMQYLANEIMGEEFKDLCRKLEINENMVRHVYIPTLYGPWQPNEYLFQQVLLQDLDGERTLKLQEQEYTHDALYIVDAIKELEHIFENKELDRMILKSEEGNQWRKCAEYLKVDPTVYRNDEVNEINLPAIKSITVKQSSDHIEGLEAQKVYAIRFLAGFL